jgi:hypothetical protein
MVGADAGAVLLRIDRNRREKINKAEIVRVPPPDKKFDTSDPHDICAGARRSSAT